ncbi:MAG: TolC family protein, partial [Bacteroidetes bacterium]
SIQAQANDLKFFGNDDGRWFNATAVGLSLNIPVFDGFRRDAQIKQAEIELLKVRNDLDNSERYVGTQFLNAQNKLTVARSSLTSQEENMALAREVYRINQLRYSEGISSLSDVLSAETALRESQSNYISSLIQYRLAELEWIRFSGNMQSLTQP